MLKSILEKIIQGSGFKDSKIAHFIKDLENENYGLDETSSYLEKKYNEILEMYKDED